MGRTALIAVGGNSLVRAGERGTIAEQLANAQATMVHVVRLVQQGWRMVITHGNGPQVGAALLRSERAAGEVYTLPLDVCVATTQSEIGYILKRALESQLRRAGIAIPVVTLLTQVRVDENDPAFAKPTKPIGPFYSPDDARRRQRLEGWEMVEIPGRGYRRVVPSPEPVEILECEIMRQILELGMIVIAVGGGGIPVVRKADGRIRGIEAVVDKDRASALLACELGMNLFVVSTDTPQVYVDYRKPEQRGLSRATASEMRKFLDEGQFPAGSMGPKIESAIRYVECSGSRSIITSYARLMDAVAGKAGTTIVPDPPEGDAS